jgi:O-antigen/teichoic acid export membrane protein
VGCRSKVALALTDAVETPRSEPEPAVKRHEAAHAAKWSLVEKWSNRLVQFIVFVLLGRLLAPTAFGLAASATVVTSLLQLFMDTGITEAIVRRPTLEDKVVHTAFWLSNATGLFLFLVGELLSRPLAAAYGQPKLVPVLMVLCTGVLFQSLGATQEALLQRQLKFKQLAARRLFAALFGGVLGIVWAAISPSVWALVAQFLGLTIFGTIVLWTVGSYRPRFQFDRSEARSLTSFGLNVLGIRFLTFLTDQGDNFIVGIVLGPTALGFYVVAFRIYATVGDVVTVALTQVALPIFSRLQNQKDALVRALLAATRASVTVGVPFMLGTAALASYLIPLLFGDKWHQSIPVMEVLSLVGLLNTVTFFDRSVLIAVGWVRRELFISLAAGLGNVTAYWVGSHWGIKGVAVALVCRAYAFWPLRLWSLKESIGMPILDYLRQWITPVAIGIAMVGVMKAIDLLPIRDVTVPLSAVAGATFYIIAIRLVAPKHNDEVMEMIGLALHRNARTTSS